MASESASPGDNADATASPQRPSPPNATARTAQAAQETRVGTNVGHSTAAPQDAPRDGMTAPAARALNIDGPPSFPSEFDDSLAKQVENDSEGPQLHVGPPGPPSFPSEFDDSLAKGDVVGQEEEAEGPQLHHGPPGPPSFPHEFDDSLATGVENELERRRKVEGDSDQNSPDNAHDDASTVHSTTGPNVAYAAAAVGPSVEGVEEENVPSLGGTPSARSRTEAEAAVGLDSSSSSSGRSTIVIEAYRVEEAEEGTVYEAELIEHKPEPFYQRKGFVSAMIVVTLLAIGVAVMAVVLPSNNSVGNTGGAKTSSDGSLLPVPGQAGAAPQTSPPSNDPVSGQNATVPRTNEPSSDPTKTPTSDPTKTPTSSPTSNPTNVPTNMPTVFALTSGLKLLAPVGSAVDSYGWSVATYGDTIIVGAPHDEDFGTFSGSAHVFVRSGDEWTHQAKLLAPDGAAFKNLGHSVAIYGDNVVVGAWGDADNGMASGSAHVFVRSGGIWTQQAKLLAPDGAQVDFFGYSVGIYEDTIVVGAGWDDDNGEDSGSAHVFARSGDNWSHQAKLLAPDGAIEDTFGSSVAIYEDIIVVGAKWDDDIGEKSGSAHVFARSGEDWTHQAKLLSPEGAAEDELGESVAIFEDTIVLGAQYDQENGANSGSAHVFVRSGEIWTHQAKLLAPDGVSGDLFGDSVAIYEDTVVLGAYLDDDKGDDSGSAYVFHRSGETWTYQAKLLAQDGSELDSFGCSVAIYGDSIVVGAIGDDHNDNGNASGSAYVFRAQG